LHRVDRAEAEVERAVDRVAVELPLHLSAHVARDVDRGLSNQSAAQSIAFQAARAGAQAADLDELRAGVVDAFDEERSDAAANDIARLLFTSYDVEGTVIDVIQRDGKVTVIVEIVDGSKTVRGEGTVRTERAG
jgi:hypothetical protein